MFLDSVLDSFGAKITQLAAVERVQIGLGLDRKGRSSPDISR